MRYEHRSAFDASAAEVHDMLTDAAFRERVCADIGALEHHVTVVPDGEGHIVTIDHTQAVRHIPSFARRLVSDTIQVVQVERWNSETTADFEVSIPGKPGQLRGVITLEPVGEGTVEQITGDLKVSVPLIGGKLESLIAGQLKAAMSAEREVGQAWLAERRDD